MALQGTLDTIANGSSPPVGGRPMPSEILRREGRKLAVFAAACATTLIALAASASFASAGTTDQTPPGGVYTCTWISAHPGRRRHRSSDLRSGRFLQRFISVDGTGLQPEFRHALVQRVPIPSADRSGRERGLRLDWIQVRDQLLELVRAQRLTELHLVPPDNRRNIRSQRRIRRQQSQHRRTIQHLPLGRSESQQRGPAIVRVLELNHPQRVDRRWETSAAEHPPDGKEELAPSSRCDFSPTERMIP